MDYAAAWNKIGTGTKATLTFSTDRINRATAATGRALDAAAPVCAPFAQRWDAEADRRMALRTPENLKKLIEAQRANTSARSTAATAKSQRTAAKAASKNPFNSARRAARTADKAARGHAKTARTDLKTAKKNYPMTLRQLAIRVHAAHTVPAGLASYAMSTAEHWTVWPAGTSLALIAANAGALFLGRREVTVQVDDEASAEERRLMERLAPTFWVQHADERGLSGTLTEHPELTAAGIVCGVRLDGKWSAKALAAASDQVRALLGMRTETRMQISRGSHGDRALIVIRTRSASDGVSMIWTPDHTGIGVDEVTGDFVDLPLKAGKHILAAGRTGMGKSVSWRPLVMRAVMADDWTAVVIDPKRQEAIGWQHCLRCVGQETNREERMARIYGMAKELTREMHRRQGNATGATWIPDGRPENRNLLVVIDEGAAIVRMSKRKEYADVLDLFEELWSEARSVGFQFVWATQFPTKAVGVPAAVKENMSAFLSLTVNPGEAERAIFGETAQQEGWLPSRLDGVPGRAMLQFEKRTPDPLRLWHVTDGMVAGLPKADPWQSPAAPAPAAEVPALSLVKDDAPAAALPENLTDNQVAVLKAVQDGTSTNAEIAKATGLNPGSVARAVDALVKRGLLAKDGTTIRTEAAA
ncbi:helix-turn-helix domain-containing protein [Streptomyces sp. SID8111]|uniref:FtsK/SpoIIIE domain-containing protein n=1 Tax=Streptomyces sp. SID8111 TaxID=2706100 RepID=UPI0013BF1605|nr:helix-turn-helix domain-containing protein [Streptomyces sp. SID8111]